MNLFHYLQKFQIIGAMEQNKHIIFTGHSSGGAIAVLATIWKLEQLRKQNSNYHQPLCITFGSPLVGDRVFGHALCREDWSRHFVHFVLKNDIVPRILLTPLSSIKQDLQVNLPFFNPNTASFRLESIGRSSQAMSLFSTVLKNTLSVTSRAACLFMGCTNLLLEAVSNFIELSPYRPFGTYIFCTGNGKQFTEKNPDSVLQLLFYSLQLDQEEEVADMAYRSLKEHLVYEDQLKESIQMQDVVYLDNMEELSLSSEMSDHEKRLMATTINDLGLVSFLNSFTSNSFNSQALAKTKLISAFTISPEHESEGLSSCSRRVREAKTKKPG